MNLERVRGLAGAILAVGAYALATSPLGGAAWSLAVLISCSGYGALVEKLGNRRLSPTMLVVTGLAGLLVISTIVARLGLLAPNVQLAFVAFGLVACALPRVAGAAPAFSISRGVLVVAFGSVALLAGIELVRPGIPFVDESANHVLAVKRLWDTGGLAGLHHQLGGQVVGASYVALPTGAHVAALFDGGICVGLLILLFAELVAEDGVGLVVFILLAAPIVLNPEPRSLEITRWAPALLHVATWTALAHVTNRRGAIVAIVLGLGLATLHNELAILAVVYVVAAVWPKIATSRAMRHLAALPMWIVRPERHREAMTILFVASIAMSLASLVLASPATRSPSAMFATWYGVGALVVIQLDTRFTAAKLPAFLVLAFLVGVTMFGPNFNELRRTRVRERFAQAAHDLEYVIDRGYDLAPDRRALQLQTRVAKGARLGFWGMSGALLDFARNPIEDLSFGGRRRTTFLSPLSGGRLDAIDYVIVEDITKPDKDPEVWDDGVFRPLARDLTLEPIARDGSFVLYRVPK